MILKSILKTLVSYINFKIHKNIYSRKWVIPILGGTGYDLLHNQEEEFIDIFKLILTKKEGCFIDIGANLGQTLLKVRSISSDVDYYGFEVNQRCCYYLDKLIKYNNLLNCEVYPIGISNKLQIVKLFSDGATGQGSSIIDGFRKKEAYKISEYVLTVDLDTVFLERKISSVSIIKIDVEGGELDALKGMANTITKYRPYIICEILPVYEDKTERGRMRMKSQIDIEMFNKDNQYEIYRILPNKKLQKLNSIGIQSDIQQCNYLFVPCENVKNLW